MNDHRPPCSEVSKRPNSSPLSQRHTKRGVGSPSVASGSQASSSSSQAATGAETHPYTLAPSCSAFPPSPLPETSESLAFAASSLYSISKGVDSSPSYIPASQTLVPVDWLQEMPLCLLPLPVLLSPVLNWSLPFLPVSGSDLLPLCPLLCHQQFC